ncbi:unnamed protein product [Clavelina lepadiformis]|uniref:Uncharacterized protein n=1 Tax=Clavelina lepadiformis TaxID=159417 RepID=A0ABP0G216_CLALP
MDALFSMLLVGLFVNANLATAKQCKVNGSLNIGPSYSSSASLVVNFPSAVSFSNVPYVYVWARGRSKHNGLFRVQVATVDLLGFDVIITKVSLNRGPWDSSLNIQWKTRDMPSMTMVPPSSLPGLRRGQVTFYQRYEHIPEIYAWARSPTNLIPRKRYTVNIRSSSNIGFTFTIRNLNAYDFNENHSLQLYWSVHQKANSEYVTKMVGNGNYSSIVDIPPITWLTTPTITETSKNVFDIFGRDIHFSVVRQMLHEATNRKFPLNQTTNAEELYQVSLRGDCVYLDFDVTMQGLKKITIHARKFISNRKTLTFKAPQICEQIIESRCIYLDKAETYLDGANGKNGIASPLVEIHVQKVEGHVEIISAANDGNFGENGSDGPAGEVGKIGKSLWVEKMHYDMQGNAIPFWRAFKCVVAKGLVGQRGGRGVDGRKAGLAGRGGHAEKVTLNTQFVLGSLKVTQRPGKGGSPAEHGYGGRGGYGGSGGCGRGCSEESCYKASRWRDRKNCALPFIDCSNNGRGRNGPIGESALDAFKIYPLPKKGENGIVKKSVLRKVDNLKVWFVNDTELLNLIRRRGELLVARNKTGDALEIFSFLTSVTDKTSSLYWQASLQKNALQGDLMYHERNNIYPSLSWTYLKERTSNLFTAGKTYETAYNNMKHKMDDLNLASQFTKKTVNVDLTKSKRNLIDELEDLKTEKRLYVKSLERIDKTMMTEQQEIKHLIPEIIRTSKQETARKQRKIFIDLIGATVGLATGIVTKGPGSVYSSSATTARYFCIWHSLYQDHEIAIKRSLYELAKAYQFMSLRKFETFKNYDNTYGDWALTSNLGQLIGMLHFQQIKQTLDDERNRFLKALSTTAGSSSHTYTLFREFDSVTHPSLMTLFRKKGRVTVHLDLNPNNITTTGCVSCYNARLMSIYVEINGSAQPEAVPFRIYVKVAHMGDSNFLLPLSDGNKTVINFQQKPEDVAGGHVVHFNRKQLVTSLLDPLLQNKFKPSEGNRFCHDYNRVQDFFGGQLCKSPYATYTITVPRRRRLPCHRHVSGTNCQDLDFTRFEKLRMFLKIKAWSNYPIPPN